MIYFTYKTKRGEVKKMAINTNLLKGARKQHRMTLDDISKELNYKNHSGYWKIEKGIVDPNTSTAMKLAKMYGIDIKELIIDEEV